MSSDCKKVVANTTANEPAKKTVLPKKSRKGSKTKSDKSWDAATFAGFGVCTEEYLLSLKPEDDDEPTWI